MPVYKYNHFVDLFCSTWLQNNKKLEVFSEDIPHAVLWYICRMKWRWGVSGIMFGFTHPVSAWLAWCLMFVSCVFSVDMLCAYIRHFLSSPHSAQLFCLHCTLVWLWCHEMYSYLLSSPSSPDPMVSRYSSTNLHCIMDTLKSANTQLFCRETIFTSFG